MLPCICPVIDYRGRQNVVRTSVTHSAIASCATFCSYHILTSSVIYYRTDARQHGIYLLNNCSISVFGCTVVWPPVCLLSRFPVATHVQIETSKKINKVNMTVRCTSLKGFTIPVTCGLEETLISGLRVQTGGARVVGGVWFWLRLQRQSDRWPDKHHFSISRSGSFKSHASKVFIRPDNLAYGAYQHLRNYDMTTWKWQYQRSSIYSKISAQLPHRVQGSGLFTTKKKSNMKLLICSLTHIICSLKFSRYQNWFYGFYGYGLIRASQALRYLFKAAIYV